jgi:hypothetical protein
MGDEMATVTIHELAAAVRAAGCECKVTGLGGNVLGLTVEVPKVPRDQCVLVTIDDGQAEGDTDVSEFEVAANYHEGTEGLTEDNAGFRLALPSAGYAAEHVRNFVEFVSRNGGDSESYKRDGTRWHPAVSEEGGNDFPPQTFPV